MKRIFTMAAVAFMAVGMVCMVSCGKSGTCTCTNSSEIIASGESPFGDDYWPFPPDTTVRSDFYTDETTKKDCLEGNYDETVVMETTTFHIVSVCTFDK